MKLRRTTFKAGVCLAKIFNRKLKLPDEVGFKEAMKIQVVEVLISFFFFNFLTKTDIFKTFNFYALLLNEKNHTKHHLNNLDFNIRAWLHFLNMPRLLDRCQSS